MSQVSLTSWKLFGVKVLNGIDFCWVLFYLGVVSVVIRQDLMFQQYALIVGAPVFVPPCSACEQLHLKHSFTCLTFESSVEC